MRIAVKTPRKTRRAHIRVPGLTNEELDCSGVVFPILGSRVLVNHLRSFAYLPIASAIDQAPKIPRRIGTRARNHFRDWQRSRATPSGEPGVEYFPPTTAPTIASWMAVSQLETVSSWLR